MDIESIVIKNQDKLDIEYTKKWAKIIASDIGNLKPVKILESVLGKIAK